MLLSGFLFIFYYHSYVHFFVKFTGCNKTYNKNLFFQHKPNIAGFGAAQYVLPLQPWTLLVPSQLS